MANDGLNLKMSERLFHQKRQRRRGLAALSFERKIALLIQLQHMASEIDGVVRGVRRTPWKIT